MKFIPILLSTMMVQALPRKTQTRRTKGLGNVTSNWDFVEIDYSSEDAYARFYDNFFADENGNPTDDCFKTIKCPYGNPGDVLWVRETFAPALGEFAYKADYSEYTLYLPENVGLWKPSIHMPKAACRHFLQIKDIRVERLQSISEKDAIAEGVELYERGTKYLNYYDAAPPKLTQFIYNCSTAVESFRSLWWLINGKRDEPNAWFKNPWVWVIEFEQIEKPASFLK